MILGGSGFIGHGLYKELSQFYNIHCTYHSPSAKFECNSHFSLWNVEEESLDLLLNTLKPDLIISAIRGDFEAQIIAHFEVISYLLKHQAKLIFFSSANVFDAFTNFPSYEYDKTFSYSVYGRFKIKIENALLRIPNEKYLIARLPMVFGAKSPRVEELKTFQKVGDSIEVFPNVVINVTTLSKICQQINYLINQEANGVYHLGSHDLIHHEDLILEICDKLKLEDYKITQVYESNDDRFLALLSKTNLLPKHLQISAQEVINDSSVLKS